MSIRIPTDDDYKGYDGAHCHQIWRGLGDDWRCPGCNRTKREVMRWTLRTPNGRRFWGWMAGLHTHHDHSHEYVDLHLRRFKEVVVCDQCNSADGFAKRRLGLPTDFSFSPGEIRRFVVATPHGKHRIELERAREVYGSICAEASNRSDRV